MAQEDILVSGSRQIVSNLSYSAETSAAWNTGSGTCKNSDSVVIAWESSKQNPASWVSNCATGSSAFSSPTLTSIANWGAVVDHQGNTAINYGNDVNVLGVPNRNMQFAFLTIMATSLDGGGTNDCFAPPGS